jgi:hypothetical protein
MREREGEKKRGKSDEREKKKKLGVEPRIGRRKQRKKKLKKNREKPEGAHIQRAERHAFITISFVLSRGHRTGGKTKTKPGEQTEEIPRNRRG